MFCKVEVKSELIPKQTREIPLIQSYVAVWILTRNNAEKKTKYEDVHAFDLLRANFQRGQ
jgi:hypothetical protein